MRHAVIQQFDAIAKPPAPAELRRNLQFGQNKSSIRSVVVSSITAAHVGLESASLEFADVMVGGRQTVPVLHEETKPFHGLAFQTRETTNPLKKPGTQLISAGILFIQAARNENSGMPASHFRAAGIKPGKSNPSTISRKTLDL